MSVNTASNRLRLSASDPHFPFTPPFPFFSHLHLSLADISFLDSNYHHLACLSPPPHPIPLQSMAFLDMSSPTVLGSTVLLAVLLRYYVLRRKTDLDVLPCPVCTSEPLVCALPQTPDYDVSVLSPPTRLLSFTDTRRKCLTMSQTRCT